MLEIVYWSCIVGFSPILLWVGSYFLDLVSGPPRRFAAGPPSGHRLDRRAPRFRPHRTVRVGGSRHEL